MTLRERQASTMKKLVIVGDSAFAEVACVLFEHDSPYRVSAFAVERSYLKRDRLLDRPVVAFEDLPNLFPMDTCDVFVAVTYLQMNRLRQRLVDEVKRLGYKLASYISSRAFLAPKVSVGEHCFIFENNNLQSFAKVGNNVVLWSGNHVGHHAEIDDHVFISSHCVISGFCKIGQHCFLGVNSTIANNVSIGADCWLGPGVVILQDSMQGQLFKAAKPEISKVDTLRYFRVKILNKEL